MGPAHIRDKGVRRKQGELRCHRQKQHGHCGGFALPTQSRPVTPMPADTAAPSVLIPPVVVIRPSAVPPMSGAAVESATTATIRNIRSGLLPPPSTCGTPDRKSVGKGQRLSVSVEAVGR